MQLFVLVLILFVTYFLIRSVARGLAWMAGARHKAYKTLAARYRGRCESRGLVDPPTVSFFHNGSNCRVGLAPVVPGQPSGPRTLVVARFPEGLPLRLELLPISRPAPPQPPRGTRPITIGVQEFDRGYAIQANDPDICRDLFGTPRVRESIDAIRRHSPPGGMLMAVNPERLLVQVDRNLGGHPSVLEQVVRHALAIHDQLLASVASQVGAGVAIVHVDEAGRAAEGPILCEVCGDPIEDLFVCCERCQTPCHRDCWAFVGGCSTFGCGHKTYRPAPAR